MLLGSRSHCRREIGTVPVLYFGCIGYVRWGIELGDSERVRVLIEESP